LHSASVSPAPPIRGSTKQTLRCRRPRPLLEASQSGLPPDQTQAQHRFDKAVARAIADVQQAREEIVAAKAAADNP
jgi:hypothetical protein